MVHAEEGREKHFEIRTASSTCLLYVLILFCSFSMSSCSLSWFLRSSSAWKASSFIRRSALRMFFWVSACLLCSLSSSPSSSLTYITEPQYRSTKFCTKIKNHVNIRHNQHIAPTLCSSLAIIFFPPLSA